MYSVCKKCVDLKFGDVRRETWSDKLYKPVAT